MSINHSAKVVTDGLVMYYDMSNAQKSWKGAPTTNLSSGIGISTYLNTPSDVTSVLTQTTDLYKGQPIYKQVLTPITATGVSQLTNSSNPGIGVVTGGGGGAAARYTGHSIYFKAALGRTGLHPSTPIYTHYSNIGGWQSSANHDDMGDGWYRAHVIYYNAAGGSDGKYWAINPQGAVLNVPITIYWAAPFKEDRNDSTFVSAYTYTSRSTTQAVLDLTGNNTFTASSLTYASDGTFSFNGSNDYIDCGSGSSVTSLTNSITVEAWINTSAPTARMTIYGNGYSGGGMMFGTSANTPGGLEVYYPGIYVAYSAAGILQANVWQHVVYTRASSGLGTHAFYINGVSQTVTETGNGADAFTTAGTNRYIGLRSGVMFNGNIRSVRVYSRALSAAEVAQNFQALRRRYSL